MGGAVSRPLRAWETLSGMWRREPPVGKIPLQEQWDKSKQFTIKKKSKFHLQHPNPYFHYRLIF